MMSCLNLVYLTLVLMCTIAVIAVVVSMVVVSAADIMLYWYSSPGRNPHCLEISVTEESPRCPMSKSQL